MPYEQVGVPLAEPLRHGDQGLVVGDWLLDSGSQRLIRGSVSHGLNPKEMGVLTHLAESAPQLVTSNQLLERTWPDVVVGDHVIHEVIGRLRRMLGDDARHPSYIETLPKRGYRLIAPVRAAAPPSRPSGARRRRTVRAVVLACVALLAAWIWISVTAPDPTLVAAPAARTTIAVLPLENLSTDPDTAHFSNVVTQEIWSRLTAVRGLRVISRTSAAAYAGSRLDVREIGERLTADYIIEGGALQSGDLVRINVHLVDSRTGTVMWRTGRSEEVASLVELFALFDDITDEIGAALPDRIAGRAVLAESSQPGTTSMAAYNLIRQAIFEMFRTGDPRASLKLAEQAVALDPDYWEAHHAVAAFHFWIAEFGWGPARDHLERAQASAQRALTLADDRSGQPYVVLGQLSSRLEPDFRRAMDMYARAEAVGADPGYLTGARQDLLFAAGRYADGVELMVEECARNPGVGAPVLLLARFLYEAGREDEAKGYFERALELSPDSTFVFRNVLSYYVLRYRDLAGARRVIAESPLTERFGVDRERALIELQEGNRQALRALVNRWVGPDRDRYVRPKTITHDLFLLEDYDGYLRWFESRVEQKDLLGWLVYELRELPVYRDYWAKLQYWALSDPALVELRLDRIRAHRALLDRLTERMVL